MGKSNDSEDGEGSEEELNEEEEEAADLAALLVIRRSGDAEDVRSSGYDDVGDVDVRSCGEPPSIGCATKADGLTQSQTLIAVLETAMGPSSTSGRREVLHNFRTKSERRREGRVLPAERTKRYCTRWNRKGMQNWPWSDSGDSCCKRTGRWRRQ